MKELFDMFGSSSGGWSGRSWSKAGRVAEVGGSWRQKRRPKRRACVAKRQKLLSRTVDPDPMRLSSGSRRVRVASRVVSWSSRRRLETSAFALLGLAWLEDELKRTDHVAETYQDSHIYQEGRLASLHICFVSAVDGCSSLFWLPSLVFTLRLTLRDRAKATAESHRAVLHSRDDAKHMSRLSWRRSKLTLMLEPCPILSDFAGTESI